MSVTKTIAENMFKAGRTAFSGSNVTIRHKTREYVGTRLPCEKGEMVDDEGAIYTVTGGGRFLCSEFAKPWPKTNDTIDVKSGESGAWKAYMVLPTRLDEMEATMLLQYGERYDQPGSL